MKTHKKILFEKNGGLDSDSQLQGPPHTMQDKLDAKPGMRLEHFTVISLNKLPYFHARILNKEQEK